MLLFVRLMTFEIRYVPLKKKSVSLIIRIICWRHLWKKLDTIYHLQKRRRIGLIQLTRLLYHLDKEIQRSQIPTFTISIWTLSKKIEFLNLEAKKKYYAVKCPQTTTSTTTTYFLKTLLFPKFDLFFFAFIFKTPSKNKTALNVILN